MSHHDLHHHHTRESTALGFGTFASADFNDYCHPASRCFATTIEPTTLTSPTMNHPPTSSKSKKRKATADSLEVIVIGLSHHNAKVDVREKLAIPEDQWSSVSAQLSELDSIHEASVLSTCNRFEIYLAGTNQYEVIRDATNFLISRAAENNHDLDAMSLRRSLFMLSGEDAIWHLLRVSAGLDSLVVGEGQILSQVKKAYEHSTAPSSSSGSSSVSSPAGKVVSRLLNTAVSAGKRVRSETGISKGAVSISSAAAEFSALMLKETCGIDTGMEDAHIVVIGAGKMARLLLIHLQTQGVKKVTVVNRSLQRIEELQREFPDLPIEAKLMDDLWTVLETADVVYPSTASSTTIIDPEPLDKLMRQRETLNVRYLDSLMLCAPVMERIYLCS